MQNLGYLFAAFLVIWLAVFAYAYSLAGRQRRLEREIQVLRAALREKPG